MIIKKYIAKIIPTSNTIGIQQIKIFSINSNTETGQFLYIPPIQEKIVGSANITQS